MSQIFGRGGGAKKRIHTGGHFRPNKMIRKWENGVSKNTRLVLFFMLKLLREHYVKLMDKNFIKNLNNSLVLKV